jgi:hypothetical protein
MKYIKRIGSNVDLVCACGNLGAYEALLYIIKNRDAGSPVHDVLKNVPSNFSGPAGINNRLKFFRELGLLEVRAGKKKSQTCLVPSEKLMNELGPILCDRYQISLLS